ncbi:MAG: hypothetical protein B7Z39_02180 [Novosphingobium sp. 12-64-8]|nr:MAG: hypothetical protein B7Z39_02180 [Novosphingobium sp. 12-64-8]
MALYSNVSTVARYNLSGNRFIDGLLPGTAYFRVAWATKDAGTTQISYSFPWADGAPAQFANNYGRGENVAAVTGGVTAAQAAQIALGFGAWAKVANVAFNQIAETGDGQVGDIRVAFSSTVPSGYWGYALGVSDGMSNAHGDVWIDDSIAGQSFEAGTYNFMAIMHEIGHAIGLKHPFEGTRIPSGFDNRRYTIMSYTDPANVMWTNPATGAREYLIKTPMVYDILAIQKIYGANMTYHTGDDTYTFTPGAPSFEAIWDAGGSDTFSVAGFAKGCTIDLRAGAYSSLNYDSVSLTSNIGIAFNCAIENAIGGAGGDTILGSDGVNVLDGGAGADVLRGYGGDDALMGSAGNDTLDGGAGNDTLSGGGDNDTLLGGVGNDGLNGEAGTDTLDGGAGNDALAGGDDNDILIGSAGDDALSGEAGTDTASYATSTATVRVSLAIAGAQVTGAAGTDSLTGIENLTGGSGGDQLTGNEDANRLDGGLGADRLTGGGGADVLIGGAGRDVLIGGGGADTFMFAIIKDFNGTSVSSVDEIVDFSRDQLDRIDLSAIDAIKATTAVNDAFTWMGASAFDKHAGQLRYVVTAGVGLLTGDIDGNGTADFAIRIDGGVALSAWDFVL